MNAPVRESIHIIQDYMEALSGKVKDEALLERFVADPELKQHIRQTEAAFPKYELVAEQIISEGDTVALRGTFHGTHLSPFAGIPATGKEVSAQVMLFYEIANGRINKHWMVLDTMALFGQLTG